MELNCLLSAIQLNSIPVFGNCGYIQFKVAKIISRLDPFLIDCIDQQFSSMCVYWYYLFPLIIHTVSLLISLTPFKDCIES